MALEQPERAVQLFAAAEAQRTAVGAPVPAYVGDRHLHDQAVAAARAALGPERFAMAWAAGSAFSLDEAIAVATTLAQGGGRSASDLPVMTCLALTPREHEVLRLLADGLADKEIAATLSVSRRTASKHVATILDKLGVDSRTAAVSIAYRNRLIS